MCSRCLAVALIDMFFVLDLYLLIALALLRSDFWGMISEWDDTLIILFECDNCSGSFCLELLNVLLIDCSCLLKTCRIPAQLYSLVT